MLRIMHWHLFMITIRMVFKTTRYFIDLSQFKSGIYFLKNEDNIHSQVQKLIIIK